jgi:hypothetical protein
MSYNHLLMVNKRSLCAKGDGLPAIVFVGLLASDVLDDTFGGV